MDTDLRVGIRQRGGVQQGVAQTQRPQGFERGRAHHRVRHGERGPQPGPQLRLARQDLHQFAQRGRGDRPYGGVRIAEAGGQRGPGPRGDGLAERGHGRRPDRRIGVVEIGAQELQAG